MTLYQGILLGRILLLVALAGLLFTLARRGVISRRHRVLDLAVLVGALASYPNFGVLHPTQSGYRSGHIHYYDAFHYFMGAKYLPELGYSGLYEATLVAGRELGAFGGINYIRDLTTYVPRPTTTVAPEPIRSRFSRARWETFKRDLAFFGPRIDAWPELLVDRGYNDPPPRALLLHLLVGRRSRERADARAAVLARLRPDDRGGLGRLARVRRRAHRPHAHLPLAELLRAIRLHRGIAPALGLGRRTPRGRRRARPGLRHRGRAPARVRGGGPGVPRPVPDSPR